VRRSVKTTSSRVAESVPQTLRLTPLTASPLLLIEDMEEKSKSELFKEVIIQLDSASREALDCGQEQLCEYIQDVLIPFIQDEMIMAAIEEMGE
jgi:hypothetical protein